MSPMIRIRLTCFRLCQLLSDIVTGTPFLETFIQSFMWPYVVLKMHMMGLDEIWWKLMISFLIKKMKFYNFKIQQILKRALWKKKKNHSKRTRFLQTVWKIWNMNISQLLFDYLKPKKKIINTNIFFFFFFKCQKIICRSNTTVTFIYKYTLILIHFFKFIKFHPVAQYNEQIYVLCEHAFSL